jgi:predicted amidohydrolase
MVGAPVVHANFVGNNPGYASLSMDKEAQGRYLGNSQIIDAQGNVLASLGAEQGTLHATLKLGRIKPTEPVTDDFWHSDVSATMRRRWANSGAQGRDYYIKETRKRLVV